MLLYHTIVAAVAVAAAGAAGSSNEELAELRRQLERERAASSALLLRAEAAEAELERLRGEDDAVPAAGSCAVPYAPIANALPNGSYAASCTGCVRWEQSVQCRCFARDAVRSAPRPGNLTGAWAVATAPSAPLAPPPPPGPPPSATPTGTVVRLDMAASGSSFGVRCVSSTTSYEHAGCAVVGPAPTADSVSTPRPSAQLSVS